MVTLDILTVLFSVIHSYLCIIDYSEHLQFFDLKLSFRTMYILLFLFFYKNVIIAN